MKLNNAYNVWTDVSHLSERAFRDVLEIAEYPIASHSNAKVICDHVRNLTDEQAEAMFKCGGFISIVYHPPFIKKPKRSRLTIYSAILTIFVHSEEWSTFV